MIKMDIEDVEYEALLGTEKTIKINKPGLAISIYHNGMDYSIRHHNARHFDTILYAWIGR